MHRILSLTAALAMTPSFALAQSATPAPATNVAIPLQEFLQRRVVEELAAEGTVLGRLGYDVRVKVTGAMAEISLIDTTSQRVVRVSKVEGLSSDRDAALATITQVVANLIAQHGQTSAEALPLASSPVPTTAPSGTDAATAQDRAEAQFAAEAIGFGTAKTANYVGDLTPSDRRRWRPWQGDPRATISYSDFYRLVNRPDLEKMRHERRSAGWSLIGAGIVVNVAASVFIVAANPAEDTGFIVAIGATAVFGLTIGGGIYMLVTQPIDQGEAKRIAHKYNNELRRKYGLPVAAEQRSLLPSIRITGVTPYLGENQGGLALGGTF